MPVSAISQALQTLTSGQPLAAEAALHAIEEILDDAEVSDAVIAGFLVALRMKGETAEEIAAGAVALRQRARALDLRGGAVLDTAGTGGDGAGTFNISTGAALVAAAAGVPVAKHGNRAASGRSGAADVLERLGVRIELDPQGLARCLERAGCCFIFAPAYHPSLARVGPIRRSLGVRTIFNLIAPLANPARPRMQLLGVAEAAMVPLFARAMANLGVDHAMVVHGRDDESGGTADSGVTGLDEISLGGPTLVAEVRGHEVREYVITPQQFGIAPSSRTRLTVRDPDDAAEVLSRALAGEPGAAQDVLALNGGAAIYVGGGAQSLNAGITRAREILEQSMAAEVVRKMRAASREAA